MVPTFMQMQKQLCEMYTCILHHNISLCPQPPYTSLSAKQNTYVERYVHDNFSVHCSCLGWSWVTNSPHSMGGQCTANESQAAINIVELACILELNFQYTGYAKTEKNSANAQQLHFIKQHSFYFHFLYILCACPFYCIFVLYVTGSQFIVHD